MRCGIEMALRVIGLIAVLAMPAVSPAADPTCPDCHNPSGIAVPHDTGCRDTTCTESCHAIDLESLNHLAGPGTPLGAGDRTAICESCHNLPFDGVYHPYRFNVMAGSPTIAGEIDLDLGCGRCHGGGTAEDAGHAATPPAKYRTKAALATVAKGMHAAATLSYSVTFTTKVTGLEVDVTAYVNCGMPCPAFSYSWNWGDTSTNEVATPSTDHTYATYGKKTISLTVLLDGKIVGAVSRSVTVGGADGDVAPVASATCDFDVNTWTVTVTDTSTDADYTPVQTVTVDWQDESGRSVGEAGAVLVHTYREPGSYTPEFTAIDSALKGSTVDLTCTPPVEPAYFSISGMVFQSDGTTAVASANVVVKQGRVRVVRVRTASDGSFSADALRPGKYKIKVRKSGFTFAIPAAKKTVGPDSSGNAVLAIVP